MKISLGTVERYLSQNIKVKCRFSLLVSVQMLLSICHVFTIIVSITDPTTTPADNSRPFTHTNNVIRHKQKMINKQEAPRYTNKSQVQSRIRTPSNYLLL